MDGRVSGLAIKIISKYGKPKLGETYEIDGKVYKVTFKYFADGEVEECDWPDADVVVIGSDGGTDDNRSVEEAKITEKRKLEVNKSSYQEDANANQKRRRSLDAEEIGSNDNASESDSDIDSDSGSDSNNESGSDGGGSVMSEENSDEWLSITVKNRKHRKLKREETMYSTAAQNYPVSERRETSKERRRRLTLERKEKGLVVTLTCDVKGCCFTTKYANSLLRHRNNIHK